jgi:hypothetical protein
MIGALMGVPGKLKTLIDRLTSTRATNLDNLDATVSSRAAASTALSTATWTSTRAGYMDSYLRIKSIQRGTITIEGSTTMSNTATLSPSVDVSKSLIMHLGVEMISDNTAGFQQMNARVALTNSTTVTASLLNNASFDAPGAVVGYQVVEFY